MTSENDIEIVEHFKNKRDSNATSHTTLKSPKFKAEWKVSVARGGFGHWEVSISQGKVPQELSGMYTTQKIATKAVEDYIRRASVTKYVERDRKAEARELRKAET